MNEEILMIKVENYRPKGLFLYKFKHIFLKHIWIKANRERGQ